MESIVPPILEITVKSNYLENYFLCHRRQKHLAKAKREIKRDLSNRVQQGL